MEKSLKITIGVGTAIIVGIIVAIIILHMQPVLVQGLPCTPVANQVGAYNIVSNSSNSPYTTDRCNFCLPINSDERDKCIGCDNQAYPDKVTLNTDGTVSVDPSLKQIDSCGVCGGTNDCNGCDGVPDSGKVNDCNGDCDGSATLDDCGVCSGGNSGHVANSDKDCNGDCNGSAVLDNCGICVGGNTGKSTTACAEGCDSNSYNSWPLLCTYAGETPGIVTNCSIENTTDPQPYPSCPSNAMSQVTCGPDDPQCKSARIAQNCPSYSWSCQSGNAVCLDSNQNTVSDQSKCYGMDAPNDCSSQNQLDIIWDCNKNFGNCLNN